MSDDVYFNLAANEMFLHRLWWLMTRWWHAMPPIRYWS